MSVSVGVVVRALDRETITYQALVQRLGESDAARAYARGMNREGRKAATAVRRKLKDETSVLVRDIRQAVKFHPASPATKRAVIKARARPLSLRYFGARQFRYGVRAKIWGRAQRYPGAFLVPSLGGNVFKRTGGFNRVSGRNNAIEKLWGPILPREMLKDPVIDAFLEKIDDISRAVDREIGKIVEGY